MKPIEPVKVIDKGIAVYVPKADKYRFVKLEILYSKTNPLFSWASCDNSENILWSNTSLQNQNGTLFIYNSNANLSIGFYKINLSAFNTNGGFIKGSLVVGITTDKANLIIGMPYSAFEPITLS